MFFTGLTRRRSAADSLGNPLGTPWGPLGDPLVTSWGPLGTPWGFLGDLLGTLGDLLGTSWGFRGEPLGTTWRPQGMSWGPLGTPWRSLWDHLPGFFVTLGASWGSFEGILDLQGAPIAPQGGPGGLLEGSWDHFGGFESVYEAIRCNMQKPSNLM